MNGSADLRMTRIPLNNGAGRMPALGFGTLFPDPAVTMSATNAALEAGFRHFDCAERYRNEREVGKALQAGGKRWKLWWITASAGPSDFQTSRSTR
jgi:alcohol dehydrogenase (NADP+)